MSGMENGVSLIALMAIVSALNIACFLDYIESREPDGWSIVSVLEQCTLCLPKQVKGDVPQRDVPGSAGM